MCVKITVFYHILCKKFVYGNPNKQKRQIPKYQFPRGNNKS